MAAQHRHSMIAALKKIVIPYLRENRFKGSFPHFRRLNDEHIDLITFQFNRYGGSFVVELAVCSTEGVTMSWGEKVLPNKVTAHDVNERIRLKDNKNDEEDFWFQYEHAKREPEFEEVASRVRRMLQVEDIGWIRDLLEKETKNCTSF